MKSITTKSRKATSKIVRVTRSISFFPEHIRHLKERALRENRSVNYLVNELIARDGEGNDGK